MTSLTDRRILLGVAGGIAAYKTADLVRRLRERGAEVRVVMTPGAQEFVAPLTFQALSGKPVHTDLLDTAAEAAMGHIELAKWAQLLLIAPVSANLLAKLATGFADNLLTTLCLASEAPLVLAPAMNQAMWQHAATQTNVQTLQQRGAQILGPASGSQACGDVGPGRMLEPNLLIERIATLFTPQTEVGRLTGKHIAITAGPTREPLDPVRYLSNYSSGKMGFALAAAAHHAGAEVTLIAGPVDLPTPSGVKRIDVLNALEMHAAAKQAADHCDLFIAAAAVADFRPQQISSQKIKKSEGNIEGTLRLVKNPDIVADIAKRNHKRPFTVGFAAETEKLVKHAREKLSRKKLDMIIANDISDSNNGFNSDYNQVVVIDREGEYSMPAALKSELAAALLEKISARAFK